MLERRTSPIGPVYYVSPLLQRVGVPHGFSTRCRGFSGGPFASLNLGNPSDDPANIRANYDLLMKACGMVDRRICRVRQVHGRNVAQINSANAANESVAADAMVSRDASCALSIRVADCLPILLASMGGTCVAAVHAGWRGIIAGVIPAAIEELRKLAGGESLVAALGPCIGIDAFEVGGEVLEQFILTFADCAPIRHSGNGKGQVDLRQAARLQLLGAGVSPECMDMTDRCTFRDAEEFYSHRRDHGVTGRMAAMIAARRST